MARHSIKVNPRSDWVHIRKLFLSIDMDSCDCWLYLGRVDTVGRGHSTWRGWHDRVHRNAYRFFHGPILAGYSICHTCDNPLCINPRHLFQGSHAENMKDKATKGRDKGRLKRFLTQRERIELDSCIADGMPRMDIAARYEVSYQYVCNRVYVTRRALQARPALDEWSMG